MFDLEDGAARVVREADARMHAEFRKAMADPIPLLRPVAGIPLDLAKVLRDDLARAIVVPFRKHDQPKPSQPPPSQPPLRPAATTPRAPESTALGDLLVAQLRGGRS